MEERTLLQSFPYNCVEGCWHKHANIPHRPLGWEFKTRAWITIWSSKLHRNYREGKAVAVAECYPKIGPSSKVTLLSTGWVSFICCSHSLGRANGAVALGFQKALRPIEIGVWRRLLLFSQLYMIPGASHKQLCNCGKWKGILVF